MQSFLSDLLKKNEFIRHTGVISKRGMGGGGGGEKEGRGSGREGEGGDFNYSCRLYQIKMRSYDTRV